MSRILNTIVLFFYLVLPLESIADDRDFVLPVSNNEIKVMSYNVENLFDAEHDEDKNDYEFLPLNSPHKSKCNEAGRYARDCMRQDWTDEKVNLKLNQIKLALEAQGALPDVLVLVEVENPKVIGRLVSHLGYDDFRMTTSPDNRGIDNAVLFRTQKMQLVKYTEAELENAHHPTRNMSAAVFKLNRQLGGGVFAVFPNHWPSQASPTPARIGVANALYKFVNKIRAQYTSVEFNYVLTGDFNVVEDETPNPIDSVLLSSKWEGGLLDVRQTAMNDKKVSLPDMPEATYFYGKDQAWNEFDRFFVNPELLDNSGLDVVLSSFRIHAPTLVSKDGGRQSKGARIPLRYNHNASKPELAGFSDHFGIVVKLRYQ